MPHPHCPIVRIFYELLQRVSVIAETCWRFVCRLAAASQPPVLSWLVSLIDWEGESLGSLLPPSPLLGSWRTNYALIKSDQRPRCSVCVCVCVRERERERVRVSVPLLLLLLYCARGIHIHEVARTHVTVPPNTCVAVGERGS